jgi:predicted nucleotidyltransferase
MSSLMNNDDLLSLVRSKVEELAQTLLASEPLIEVFLFGSRASGRAGSRSDIDVGIDLGHTMTPEVLAAVRDAFADLPIMQKIDVVDFFGIDATFKTVALQKTMSLYERQAAVCVGGSELPGGKNTASPPSA